MKKILFALLVAVMFIGCQEKKNDKIRVGVILPLTGDAANYGQACKNGIELSKYIDSLNVEYIYEDSKGNPKTAISAFKKLLSANQVDYFIGDMFSSTTLAIAPLAKETQKILISPTASSKDISYDNIYALSVFPSESYEAKLIADFAKEKYSRIGVLYEKVAAAQVMYDSFVEVIGDDNISCGLPFDSNTMNFHSDLHKIKQAGCDVVYLITYSNKATQIIKQAQELNINVDFMGQSALYDPSLFPILQTLSTNFYLTGPIYNPLNRDKQSVAFTNQYRELYNEDANQMVAQGYVAAIIAHELNLLIENQSYTRENIAAISKSFFGASFGFDEDLCSTSGLCLYEYNDHQFILLR